MIKATFVLASLVCLTLTTPGWALTFEEARLGQGNFCHSEPDMPKNVVCGDGVIYVPEPKGDGWVVWDRVPCLATMEAAMRAMEPFIGTVFKRGTTVQQWDHATLQWDAAKKACWKEKP